jgi:hypothetical protein
MKKWVLILTLTTLGGICGGLAQEQGPPSEAPAPAEQPAPDRGKNAKAPKRRIVRDAGTTEPDTAISPEMTPAEAQRLQKITNDLVAESEKDLQKIEARELTPEQQETKAQIRSFLNLSKSARDASDWQRAHNLALKAQLLADDLVKQ